MPRHLVKWTWIFGDSRAKQCRIDATGIGTQSVCHIRIHCQGIFQSNFMLISFSFVFGCENIHLSSLWCHLLSAPYHPPPQAPPLRPLRCRPTPSLTNTPPPTPGPAFCLSVFCQIVSLRLSGRCCCCCCSSSFAFPPLFMVYARYYFTCRWMGECEMKAKRKPAILIFFYITVICSFTDHEFRFKFIFSS